MRTRAGDCLREAISMEHVSATSEDVCALQMYPEDWLDILRMVESFELNMDRQLARHFQVGQAQQVARRNGNL